MHPNHFERVDDEVFAPADLAISQIASRQDGRVTRSQLIAAGLTDKAIRHRVEQGRLHRIHRGVYAVGHTADPVNARDRAALYAVGPDSFLSHFSAASHDGFRPGYSGPVHVTVPRSTGRNRKGIVVHRTTLLDPRDFTRKDDLPITTPARTLLDLTPALSMVALERAIAEAMVLKLVNERHLTEVIARAGRHRGVNKLRRALEQGPDLTRSEVERILRRLLKQAGLPAARTNYRLAQGEVDFYFPSHSVVVEVDGRGPHGTPRAFENDRRKRSELAAAGYTVLVFSDKQLTDEPHWVVAQIAQALSRAEATGALDRAA